MSRLNIRTLSDLRREDEAAAATNRSSEASPLIWGKSPSSDSGESHHHASEPRSMPIRFLELIFPNITWKSSVLVLSITQWAVYIATLCVGSAAPLVPEATVLVRFGAMVPSKVQAGEVWRLITPIFLHANFIHIFFNIFFQLRMGFTIERRYGLVRFLILYFASGIFGNVFSATTLFCDPLRVGASTAGFGLIGTEMTELALRWHRIRHRDRAIVDICLFLLLMTLFMFSMNGKSIDQMGHLGGFLCGSALAFVFNYDLQDKPTWFRFAYYGSIASLLVMWLTCVPILFALHRTCD